MKKWMTAAAVFLGAAICCAGASISASAEVTRDDNGVLHLYGNFTKEELDTYRSEEWWRYMDSDKPFNPHEMGQDESLRCYKIVAEEGAVFPADSSWLFENYVYLESVDFTNADTSRVTDMSFMFQNCGRYGTLSTLDLSCFDTSKVTTMEAVFFNCSKLQSLDLNSFDTSKVTDMKSMFRNCCNLKGLDLSSFDTSNVTETAEMFEDCISLESVNLSSFDTSKVTDMRGMFTGCKALKELDLSNFDTSNVTEMGG